MKQFRLAAVVLGVAVALMGAATGWDQWRNEGRGAERVARQWVGDGPAEPTYSFGPVELTTAMAKTKVPGSQYSASFTFRHALWPGMDALNLYVLGGLSVGTSLGTFTLIGHTDGAHPGQFGFGVQVGVLGGMGPSEIITWYDVPVDAGGVTWIELNCAISVDTASATKLTSGTNIIGDKAYATHAKEMTLTEAWFLPAGSTVTATVEGETVSGVTSADIETAMGLTISGTVIDADDWSDYLAGTKYTMSIGDLCIGGTPINTSGFTARTWGGGAGTDNLWVEGFGSGSIGFWCGTAFYSSTYFEYPAGVITAPYVYNFEALKFKWLDGTDIPTTVKIYCTGIRQLNSSGVDIGPWHGTIAELRALGTYVQKYGCYYWDAFSPDCTNVVQLYLDMTSAEHHGIEIRSDRTAVPTNAACATPSFDHDATFIPDAWPPSAANHTSAPYMNDVAVLTVDPEKNIYANAHDHTDWVGSGVTTPTNVGRFTVGSGGGTLTLTPKCNYRARQAESKGIGFPDAIVVPTCYLDRRHDTHLGQGTTPETAEAVWDWRGFYLKQSFRGLTLPCNLVCTIQYYMDLDGVTDTHDTDNSRQTDYAYDAGELYTLTRTIPVTWQDAQGWAPVLVDLYDERHAGQPVAMAYTLQWQFPAAGSFEMTAPFLVHDTGDRQEVTRREPYYREAPRTSGLTLKIDESWRWAQGLVSAHLNGLSRMTLFVPDNERGALVEKTFPTLNPLYGEVLNLTTNYTLGTWPVTNSGECFTLTHHSDAEDAHMVDVDGVRLKSLQCLDLAPQYALGHAQFGPLGLPVAVRVYSLTCVRGLTYNFQGTKLCGGVGHGMAVSGGADFAAGQAFPRRRGGTTGYLYRRYLGTDDGWTQVAPGTDPDEHGHYDTAAYRVRDEDTDLTLYEYALRQTGEYESYGRFATRKFAHLQAVLPGLSQPDSKVHPVAGVVHLAANYGNNIIYCSSNDVWDGWRYAGNAPAAGVPTFCNVFSEPGWDNPALALMPSGKVIVGARRVADNLFFARYTNNMGTTWEGGLMIGSGLSLCALAEQSGILHCVGYSGGKLYYQRSDDDGLSLRAFADSSTSSEVGDATEERPTLVVLPSGSPVAQYTGPNGISAKVSYNGGHTWTACDTLAV